jgi:RNA polymerase sigma-70 factor (ECF subfamily)
VTVDERNWQTEEFERHRRHLRAVAYRMLGSLSDADDVVQEAWLRLNRSDADSVENMRGWLTTVVARLCLDVLRARQARREDYVGEWLTEPLVALESRDDPEQEALLADSVGLALLVVLETLGPAERLAFVLPTSPRAICVSARSARRSWGRVAMVPLRLSVRRRLRSTVP